MPFFLLPHILRDMVMKVGYFQPSHFSLKLPLGDAIYTMYREHCLHSLWPAITDINFQHYLSCMRYIRNNLYVYNKERFLK